MTRATTEIHPSAVIEPEVQLGSGVRVHPGVVIEGPAEIGDGVEIGPHAVIHRWVRLGAHCRVHAHAVLGGMPQHHAYTGEETWLEIGPDCTLREGVTVSRSMLPDQPTRIGASCFLMAYAHVAHDCQLGDGVLLTNNVCLGGLITIGDRAVVGGMTAVHQYVRIGAYAMVGGFVPCYQDVIPYTMLSGIPARHFRLNTLGLRRNGITGERYRALEKAFRRLRAGDRLRDAEDLPDTPEVRHLRAWLDQESKRGIHDFAQPGTKHHG